jgi:hypothetical protein
MQNQEDLKSNGKRKPIDTKVKRTEMLELFDHRFKSGFIKMLQ